MKKILLIILTGFLCISCTQNETIFSETKDAYFGLTPPGLIPKIFAPGIVSDTLWAEHCQVAVSPNGDEIYWSAWTGAYKTEDGEKNTEQLFYSKFESGIWSKPKRAEFTEGNLHGLNGGPSFSPDGKKLFFYQVKSPWVSSPKRCYYVEKKNGVWSNKPIDVGQPYSSESYNSSPVFSKKGHSYKNARGTILKFLYDNEKFTFLDTIVIHKDFRPAWNFYVSPMEDYIIFAARHESGFGDIDLYISFKTKEDTWGLPINMGNKINTELRERFPIVSPDGKYLFFMRHTPGQDFFWVSTKLIENLKSQSNPANSSSHPIL